MGSHQERETALDSDDGRKPLLKTREASQLLSVHPNTLRRWSDLGLVKTYRIGFRGDRRFKLEDIAKLLTEQPNRRRAVARKHNQQHSTGPLSES